MRTVNEHSKKYTNFAEHLLVYIPCELLHVNGGKKEHIFFHEYSFWTSSVMLSDHLDIILPDAIPI